MLIFFDIDGTLFGGSSQDMSESTKEAIRRARRNGHYCVINTGRTRRLVGPEITGQVEFDGVLLGCGTMAVWHDEVMMHYSFPLEQSLRIMDGLERHGIDAVLEGSEEDYCARPEEIRSDVFRSYLINFPGGYAAADLELAPGRFDKLFAYVEEPERMQGFQDEFNEELDFIDRGYGYYEMVPKGYSKATIIRYLAEKLKVPMEETAAIGDSSNDIPMLECAHTAIAMGNGTEDVKRIADFVTSDVMEDGIWNALDWLGVL